MYSNPYYDQDFFGFFITLFIRIWQFFTGQFSFSDIAPDEIQIIVLSGVAASAALVGCFLVLRKMAMMANSLSHTILLGILVAFLFTRSSADLFSNFHLNIKAMLFASLIVAFLTTFLTEFLTKTVKLQEDASTGIIFTSLFALGIVLVTLLTKNAHIGVEAVMGNVDALHIDDCKLVFMILCFNVLFFFLFYKEFQITTFDPSFAKAIGISSKWMNYLLMTLASATIVGAFRAVGVLMVLTFITGPSLASRLVTNSLNKMLLVAVFLGVISSLIGVALSRHLLTVYGLALSTAGIVVAVTVILYLLLLFLVTFKSFYHTKKLAKL